MNFQNTFSGLKRGFFNTEAQSQTSPQNSPDNHQAERIQTAAQSSLKTTSHVASSPLLNKTITEQIPATFDQQSFELQVKAKVKEAEDLFKKHEPNSAELWLTIVDKIFHYNITEIQSPQGVLSRESIAFKALQAWESKEETWQNKKENSPFKESAARAWIMLGMAIKNFNTNLEVFGKKNFSFQDCCIKAIELNPTCKTTASTAWNNLAKSLDRNNQSTSVCGQKVNVLSCYLQSIKLEPNSSVSWANLLQHLSLLPKIPESLKIDGKLYSIEACCLKAMELSPKDPLLWQFVGRILDTLNKTLKVQEGKLTATSAFLQSLDLERLTLKWPFQVDDAVVDETAYWNNLGRFLIKSNSKDIPENLRKRLTPIFCYSKFLESAKKTNNKNILASAWERLGSVLSCSNDSAVKVKIEDKDYDAIDCFIQSLQVVPEGSVYCWENLSYALSRNAGEVTIGSTKYTALKCAVKAVEADWESPEVHKLLIETMQQSGVSFVEIRAKGGAKIHYTKDTGIKAMSFTLREDNTSQKILTVKKLLDDDDEQKQAFLGLVDAFNQAMEEFSAAIQQELLAEQDKKDKQRAHQLEINKLKAEAKRNQIEAESERGAQLQETALREEEKIEASRKVALQSVKTKNVALRTLSKDDDDPTEWKQVPVRTPHVKRTKDALQELLSSMRSVPANCQVNARVTRWRKSGLTEADVRKFQDTSKDTGKVICQYSDYTSARIQEEIKAHYLPPGLEELVDNSNFREKFCKELNRDTLLMRGVFEGKRVLLCLGLSHGNIYHARMTSKLEQEELKEAAMTLLPGEFQTKANSSRAAASSALAETNITMMPVTSISEKLRKGISSNDVMIQFGGAQPFYLLPWLKPNCQPLADHRPLA